MKNLTTDTFKENVYNSDKKVAVLFTAPWCGFCKSMKRMLETVENEWGNAEVFCVDVDSEKELSKEFAVSSVPALFVFADGKVTKKATGLMKKSELYAILGIEAVST